MTRLTIFFVTFILTSNSYSQKGVIIGRLIDFKTNKPVIEAPVILFGTTYGVRSDSLGDFQLEKLKLKNTELIVHGQSVYDFSLEEKWAKANNYYTLILRDIQLSKEKKTVDLGTIYMINLGDENGFIALPCILVDSNLYSYRLVDGSERYINGKMGLIDFKIPSTKCSDE